MNLQAPKKSYLDYLMVFSIAFMVYANTLNHEYVLDDDIVFVKNTYVQNGISSIPDILTHGFLHGFNQKNDQSYRPLVLIHYAIEHSLFGNNPKASHFFNVFYYGLLCVVLLFFLKTIFKDTFKNYVLVWICLLYVLHPIHTEVVANIKGRDEIFHAILALLTLSYVIKFLDTDSRKYLIYSLLTFFLALLSKEMALTLLGLIPLTIYFFTNCSIQKNAKTTLWFSVVVLIYFIIRSSVLDTITFEQDMTVMNNGIAAATNMSSRIATTFYIFAAYLMLLIFPKDLSWDYSIPHFKIVDFGNPIVIIVIGLVLALSILSILQIKKKDIFAYSWLFFILSFSIVSNFFILIGATLGERFLFFPSVGFAIAMGVFFAQLLKKINPKIVYSMLVIIGLLYSASTISRNKDWKNNHSLFEAGAETTPNNSRAISALATAYREKGEQTNNINLKREYFSKAVTFYLKSIELYNLNNDAWYNLGVTYMNQGNDQAAKSTFISLLNINPTNLNGLNNLGVIYFREKNFTEAEKLYLKSLELNPNFQNAYANLGAIYHNIGDPIKAEQYYLKALQLNPNDGNTQSNYRQLKTQLNK